MYWLIKSMLSSYKFKNDKFWPCRLGKTQLPRPHGVLYVTEKDNDRGVQPIAQ